MRHILLARRASSVPHMWGRHDWNGVRWTSSDLVLDRGAHGASSVQYNLASLVEGAIADIGRGGSVELTITPRAATDLISGGPGSIDVPLDSTAVVLCPMWEGEPEDSQIWVQALINPAARSPVMILAEVDRRFVKKRLDVALKGLLTKPDLDERGQLHCRRELWVRPGISAELLAPSQIKPRVAAPPDPVLVQAEEQMAMRQVRAAATAKGKITAKRSTDAIEFNRKAAAKYGKEQAARRAKAK